MTSPFADLTDVVTDPEVRAGYERDWTGEFVGRAREVVRPASTAEVAAVVAACASTGTPIVPQGGNTGLVGGSVPDASGRAVVVSTHRLGAIGPVDRVAGQVTVDAGVTVSALDAAVRPAGWAFAIDLAARDSATVGGLAATNAGGIHVLRHGMMRRQVVGVEAVLADGTVVSHLGGLEKDNTGYDLAGLLCGSEGTLGVITRLRVRLVPVEPARVTALVGWPDVATMVAGMGALRLGVPGLEAAEYVVAAGVELVASVFEVRPPFAAPCHLLLSAAGQSDPTEALAGVLAGLAGVVDVAVATGEAQRAALWRVRELHTEALAAVGPPRKYDVTVPVAGLAAFVNAAVSLCSSRGLVCHHFGHLADGNVHLNVLGAADGAGLDEALLGLVADHGGSISAEHGIGRLKRPWLHLSRSRAEIDAMRAIKSALDPAGILNPGVLLP